MPPAFDTSGVSPSDAALTLRSLLRRFAEAFLRAERPELLTRPAANGLSPVAHAAWAATALGVIGPALRRVLLKDNPQVDLPPVDPPDGDAALEQADDSPAAALNRLSEQAQGVADLIADTHGEDWARTGEGPAGPVSALDIARLAVRIGVEHLRAAEAAVGPSDPAEAALDPADPADADQ